MIAIDDHNIASLDSSGCVIDPTNHRDIESSGDNRDVRGWRALFKHQSGDPPAQVIHQFGWTHRPGNQDEFLRQFR